MISQAKPTIRQRPFLRLLLGTVCISFSPVFIKVASVGPDSAGFYRMLFAGVSLYLLMNIRREGLSKIGKGSRLMLCFAGVFLSVDFMCWHRSIELIGPGLSTLLGNFQVFFTAIFSWLIFKQKINRMFILAIIISIVGLCMITGLDIGVLDQDYKLGVILGLLTAVFYSAYILLVKKTMDDESVKSVPAMLLVAIPSTLMLAVIAPMNGQSFVIPNVSSLLALVGVGVISTTIGWSLISSAIRHTQVTVASLMLLLQPALAMVWDTVFFNRPTGGMEILGVFLILSGIYLGSYRSA